MPYCSISFTIGSAPGWRVARRLADGDDVLVDLLVHVHLAGELPDPHDGLRVGHRGDP